MPHSPLARGPIGNGTHGLRTALPADSTASGRLADWHARNRRISLPHGIRELESQGNLDNLRRLTGESDAPFRGQLFADSDVYKMLEAVAWELGRADDAQLRTFFDDTVSLLERAQRADGYLDSAYQDHPDREPWSNFVHGHELYCLGHLIQAAVAAQRALGDDRLMRVSQRFVALVDDLFGADDRVEYCGHPLIETALIEMYRTTGDAAALRLAESFIRRRGSGFIGEGVYGAPYYQDDLPVLSTTTMRGHAVRALYLNQGVTDLYLEGGDRDALAAMRVQWDDMVSRRIYITGGTGSRHQDEAFGAGFELPADRAYSETCAGIALFGWAWRMYLATGEARYLDTGEIALHNVVLAGISDSGDTFTYSNPLQRRREHVASRQEESSERLSWFSCACCPPNLMRTFGSLEHYVGAAGAGAIDIAHYLPASVSYGEATLTVRTDYPATGAVSVTVAGDAPGTTLRLRVPAWAHPSGVSVRVDGTPRAASVGEGWIALEDALRDGAVIDLELPMTFDVRHPHRRADALRGSVAISRGPVVYCAEQGDNDIDVDAAQLSPDSIVTALETSTEIGPLARVAVGVVPIPDDAPLYSTHAPAAPAQRADLVLRPYATWGNNGVDAMRVWLPADS
ncbi:glycoside hydrolase family 127 protein [Microbacterium sp. NPDC055357]